mgnify:CR=1 FL=1
MVKDRGQEQPPENSDHPANTESLQDLEAVLASFVQTFESSAQ